MLSAGGGRSLHSAGGSRVRVVAPGATLTRGNAGGTGIGADVDGKRPGSTPLRSLNYGDISYINTADTNNGRPCSNHSAYKTAMPATENTMTKNRYEKKRDEERAPFRSPEKYSR